MPKDPPPRPNQPRTRRPKGSGHGADPRPAHPRNAAPKAFRFTDWAML